MLVVRAARSDDHAAFVELARAAGPGFTSLSLDDEALHAKLLKSEQAFEGVLEDRSECVYQLMLEDSVTGQVYGTAAVKAEVGVKKPSLKYARRLQQAAATCRPSAPSATARAHRAAGPQWRRDSDRRE